MRASTYVDTLVQMRADGRTLSNRLLYLLARAVTEMYGRDIEKVLGLMHWVHENVPSEGPRPGISDNYMRSALEIIEHGRGVCGSQAEVLAAMAWYAGYPSRRVGVYGDGGHTVVEVYLDDRWSLFDPHFDEIYPLEDGTPANAWECRERPELIERVHEGLSKVYREVVIAQTLWSVDGYYLGEKFHAGPDNLNYLYGRARDPKVRELIAGRKLGGYYIVRIEDVEKYGMQQ